MERSLTGIRDVDLEIIGGLDDKSLLNFCLTSKYAVKLCSEESFWMKRFYKFFGEKLAKDKPNNQKWKNYYLYFVYWTSKLKEDFNFINQDLRDDPRKYYKTIRTVLWKLDAEGIERRHLERYYGAVFGSQRYRNDVFDDLMTDAINLGYLDLVKFSINQGADNFQGGLDTASYSGNFEMFNFFESLGANDYREALEYARDGRRLNERLRGNLEMVSFIENKI